MILVIRQITRWKTRIHSCAASQRNQAQCDAEPVFSRGLAGMAECGGAKDHSDVFVSPIARWIPAERPTGIFVFAPTNFLRLRL